MVFFVYVDPAVFGAAGAADGARMGDLTAMLRGFVQNCVLLDFEDYRWETSVGQEIRAFEAVFDRSPIKKLLVQLKKRNRVVPFLRDDDSGRQEPELVSEQAAQAELDCIVAERRVVIPSGCLTETATLASYQASEFEQQRSEVAAYGREYSGGEVSEAEFLSSNFRKVLRYARRIEICDAILGRKFGDNYRHGLKRLLDLVITVSLNEVECLIHCEESERTGLLTDMFRELQPRLSNRIRLSVRLYSAPAGGPCLPHERFLWTDQFAIELGRGMDLLDRRSGMNRDVSLNLKDPKHVAQKVAEFSRFQVVGQPAHSPRGPAGDA